jgi:hypothetical protein
MAASRQNMTSISIRCPACPLQSEPMSWSKASMNLMLNVYIIDIQLSCASHSREHASESDLEYLIVHEHYYFPFHFNSLLVSLPINLLGMPG